MERSPDKVTRPEDLRELSCEYIGMSIPRWPKDKSKPIAKRLVTERKKKVNKRKVVSDYQMRKERSLRATSYRSLMMTMMTTFR